MILWIKHTWRELDVFRDFVQSPVVKEPDLVPISDLVLTSFVLHLLLGDVVLQGLKVLPEVIQGFKEHSLI